MSFFCRAPFAAISNIFHVESIKHFRLWHPGSVSWRRATSLSLHKPEKKNVSFPFFTSPPSRLGPLQIPKYPEQHVSAGQQCKTVTCKSTPNVIISINGCSLKLIIIKKKTTLPTSLKIVLFLCNYLQMAISGAGATVQLTFGVCQEFFTTCYT